MGKVSKIKNDWLSELEAWEEREKDEDIRRMARVIREFAECLETFEGNPTSEWSVESCVAFNNLSDDAKELLK